MFNIKQVRQQLNSDEVFSLLSDHAPVLLYYVGTDLRYRYANDYFRDIHNIAPEEMHGLHIKDVIGEDGFAEASCYYQQVLAGETVSYEAFFKTKEGKPHHYRATYVPHIKNKQVIGFAGFVNDITDFKKNQQSREEVFRLLSHDIKTPLSSILSLIEYGRDREDILNEIARYTEQCMTYADNFLHLSEVEHAANQVSFENTDLIRVIEDAVDLILPMATKYQVAISLQPQDNNLLVLGNNFILHRMFVNLLDNAIKYSDPNKQSTISVSINCQQNQILVELSDNGLGLSENHLASISKGFNSSITSYYNRHFGLGLRYVSVASQLHQATIEFSSQFGHSTQVNIAFPRHYDAPRAAPI